MGLSALEHTAIGAVAGWAEVTVMQARAVCFSRYSAVLYAAPQRHTAFLPREAEPEAGGAADRGHKECNAGGPASVLEPRGTVPRLWGAALLRQPALLVLCSETSKRLTGCALCR